MVTDTLGYSSAPFSLLTGKKPEKLSIIEKITEKRLVNLGFSDIKTRKDRKSSRPNTHCNRIARCSY